MVVLYGFLFDNRNILALLESVSVFFWLSFSKIFVSRYYTRELPKASCIRDIRLDPIPNRASASPPTSPRKFRGP